MRVLFQKRIFVYRFLNTRLNIQYGTVTNIDLEEKAVYLDGGEAIQYDDLIIGLGCEDKYHNVPGAKEYTHSLQSIEQTRKTYEQLNSLEPNATVAVVGAGLSGVEVASELRESRSDLKFTYLIEKIEFYSHIQRN